MGVRERDGCVFWSVDVREEGMPPANREQRQTGGGGRKEAEVPGRRASRCSHQCILCPALSILASAPSAALTLLWPGYLFVVHPDGCFRWAFGLPRWYFSHGVSSEPVFQHSTCGCFAGPAALLLNPLQLHYLTRSHLTLRHPLLSKLSHLWTCVSSHLAGCTIAVTRPASFSPAGSLFVSVPQGFFLGSCPCLFCTQEYEGGLLVDHGSLQWDINFVSRDIFLGDDL